MYVCVDLSVHNPIMRNRKMCVMGSANTAAYYGRTFARELNAVMMANAETRPPSYCVQWSDSGGSVQIMLSYTFASIQW